MATRSETYHQDGFVLLENLLPVEVVRAYLSIMQKAIGNTPAEQKRFILKAHAVPKASIEVFSQHFPFSLGPLWGLTPIMEQVVGRPLLPCYSYGRVYPEGAQLDVHSDRQSNEHSLNLTLDYSDDTPWAFEVEKRRLNDNEIIDGSLNNDFGGNEYATIHMKPGDAVAYQGVRHRHARMTPNPNRWSAHLFLGWVDRDGPHKDHAFDGLGLPKRAEFHFD